MGERGRPPLRIAVALGDVTSLLRQGHRAREVSRAPFQVRGPDEDPIESLVVTRVDGAKTLVAERTSRAIEVFVAHGEGAGLFSWCPRNQRLAPPDTQALLDRAGLGQVPARPIELRRIVGPDQLV